MTPALEHLARSILDGTPVDWTITEHEQGLDPAIVQALRDLSRITEFSRSVQRTPSEVQGTTGIHPRQWGELTLLEPIAAGARGEVWRAWDSTLQREVALKFLQPSGGAADSATLRNEARALARVRHSSVVSVYGTAEHDNRPGMWMEYLRGMTLAQEIERRGALPARDVARLGIELCSALEAVHAAGLVHRDVKPANIILEADDRVVLTDFGLGMRSDLVNAMSRGTSGTPMFMPPEVLNGEPATVQSDLYALGATLWWAMTGALPFQASTLKELRERVARGPLNSPGVGRRGLPRSLVSAIEWAMNPDAAKRPTSASELMARLQALVTTRMVPTKRRRSRRMILAATGISAVMAGLFLGPTPLHRWGGSPSLAVLPFANLSGDSAQDYFSAGMTEELIGRFAQIENLRVISHSSVMPFKGSHASPQEIAKKLRVRMVLEGSVARSGDRARVSARLVDAPSGRAVWAGTYERDLSDVFALQSELAKAVAHMVEAKLTPGERLRLERKVEVNPEAHTLYLQGLAASHLLTADSIRRAIQLFRRASEIDPTYADPWTGLASTYDFAVAMGLVSQEGSSSEALRAARRALELDPGSSRARAILATVQLDYDWDFNAAERGCREALALAPGDPDVRCLLAITLIQLGRFDEALREAKRARDADPLSLAASAVTLFPLLEARRYPEVVRGARDILVLHPDAPWIVLLMGMSLFLDGRQEEGIATLERSVRLDSTPHSVGWLGYAYGRAGKPDRARTVLADLRRMDQDAYIDPYYFGIIHLGLGERSRALEYIEQAGRSHSPEAKLLRVDPVLDPLRAEPRFRALLKELRMES